MSASERSILREDETCWRIGHADRATVLIDGAAYFGALRESLKMAQRTAFIVGWDIDSRTRLVGPSGETGDDLPDRLGPFLTELVNRRPDLNIYILLWDYSILYALEREPLPSIKLAWNTPEQISVCLDDVLPIGACHHQKIVVIDDSIAFTGGLDLTIRRWDTPSHEIENPKRIDPAGDVYRPFHDIQMVVDGGAARLLGEIFRSRWRNAACERLDGSEPGKALWPDAVDADFADIEIGIARTLPEYDGKPSVCEVEALYRRSIEVAETAIYIESQYLTADGVASCLAQRMKRNTNLEALIVGPNVHQSWLEERSMNAGRRRFMSCLEQASVTDRVRLLYPALAEDRSGEGVMVHAKFMIVDDRFLRVGSANLNNRSMGLDTECDLALEASRPADRQKISEIRNRLMAEHLGVTSEDVKSAIERHGTLIGSVDALTDGDRTLRPIDLSDVPDHDLTLAIGNLADPEQPIRTPSFVGDLFGGEAAREMPGRFMKLLLLSLATIGLIALWRYSPLSELANPTELVAALNSLGEYLYMPILIPAMFLIGGFVAFPVTVLIVVVGMMFSPEIAFAYALSGSSVSAMATFFIGHALGRSVLRDLMGPRVNQVSRALASQGVLSVATLRMLPIAPFTFINLIAGASHIRALDFLAGTIAGMAPGIFVVSLLGYQIGQVLKNPEPSELLWLGLGVAGWLALSVALQYFAGRLRSRDEG